MQVAARIALSLQARVARRAPDSETISRVPGLGAQAARESYMSTYRATPWGRRLLGADARQAGQFLQGHVGITGRAAVVVEQVRVLPHVDHEERDEAGSRGA